MSETMNAQFTLGEFDVQAFTKVVIRAFGNAAVEVLTYLKEHLTEFGLGFFEPFLVAAADAIVVALAQYLKDNYSA